MSKRKNCPHCGQPMPLTTKDEKWRLRIKQSTIIPSNYVDGALAWFIDGDEGGTIGQDGTLPIKRLREEFKKQDSRDMREGYAVEIAAKVIAVQEGVELSSKGAWIWRKPIKKRLIELAEKILNGEDES